MKLLCKCGHVISDQTDYLAYKATFEKDQDEDKLFAYGETIRSFLGAVASGNRKKWLAAYFPNLPPRDYGTDADIIVNIAMNCFLNEHVMYQCENCDRLLVQVNRENKYASFLLEDEYGKNILSSNNPPVDN